MNIKTGNIYLDVNNDELFILADLRGNIVTLISLETGKNRVDVPVVDTTNITPEEFAIICSEDPFILQKKPLILELS